MDLTWIILFAPLVACILITLFTLHDKRLSGALSIGSALASFIATIVVFADYRHGEVPKSVLLTWLDVGNPDIGKLHIPFGFVGDNLSMMMLLVVTGVSSAIFIYSYGYMSED